MKEGLILYQAFFDGAFGFSFLERTWESEVAKEERRSPFGRDFGVR
jgi:hypothetical protein